jgi:hypothetical protein
MRDKKGMSYITAQDAQEHLLKWANESPETHALFISVRSNIHLFARGLLKQAPDYTSFVLEDRRQCSLAFNCADADTIRLENENQLREDKNIQQYMPGFIFASAVVFTFKRVEILYILRVRRSNAM